MVERWEYRSIKRETKGFMGGILDTDDFDSQLNQLGDQGWELVSCLATSYGEGTTREVIAVLKRKR